MRSKGFWTLLSGGQKGYGWLVFILVPTRKSCMSKRPDLEDMSCFRFPQMVVLLRYRERQTRKERVFFGQLCHEIKWDDDNLSTTFVGTVFGYSHVWEGHSSQTLQNHLRFLASQILRTKHPSKPRNRRMLPTSIFSPSNVWKHRRDVANMTSWMWVKLFPTWTEKPSDGFWFCGGCSSISKDRYVPSSTTRNLGSLKQRNCNSKEQTIQNNQPTDRPTDRLTDRPTDRPTDQPTSLVFLFLFQPAHLQDMALASNFCISGLSGRGDPRTLGRDRSKPRLLRRNRGAGDRIWGVMVGGWEWQVYSPENIPHE